MTDPAFIIRPGDFRRKGERNWIIKSWLACDRATPAARAEGARYMAAQSKRIEALLDRSGVLTLVATSAEDDNALAGFSVREGATRLHYVYVRKAAQRVGLARMLCEGLGEHVVCSHEPVDRAVKWPPGWTYDRPKKDSTPCASAT